MTQEDYLHKLYAQKYPYLEGFRTSMKQLLRYGLSDEDCIKGVESACDFFEIPMPAFIADLTNHPYGQTMFLNRNPGSFLDDIICYDLEQLLGMGIKNEYAFTLVMTHECGHRVMQNTQMPGLANGQWEQELVADFFMGVRAGVEGFPHAALDAVRRGLMNTPGGQSHPTGDLRNAIISYGYTYVGNMDLIHHRKQSIQDYIQIFESWRQKHQGEIRQSQVLFYGY